MQQVLEAAHKAEKDSPFAGLSRLAYPVDAASVMAGISRSKLYELMNAGTLKSVKRGGRRLILKTDLEAFLIGEAA